MPWRRLYVWWLPFGSICSCDDLQFALIIIIFITTVEEFTYLDLYIARRGDIFDFDKFFLQGSHYIHMSHLCNLELVTNSQLYIQLNKAPPLYYIVCRSRNNITTTISPSPTPRMHMQMHRSGLQAAVSVAQLPTINKLLSKAVLVPFFSFIIYFVKLTTPYLSVSVTYHFPIHFLPYQSNACTTVYCLGGRHTHMLSPCCTVLLS
jgi:hypothetical protein